ncbi:MAG: glycoside hydrolase family 16, partial [Sphingomonas bacterium]|nr:glycoside hydrolase family 16 [Sphingomonas bacterium]
PPEIDIFEFLNGPAGHHDPLERRSGQAGEKAIEPTSIPMANGTALAFDWTPEWLVTFVDGQEVHRTGNISHEPMYILINTAVGLLSTGPPQARGPRPAGRTT